MGFGRRRMAPGNFYAKGIVIARTGLRVNDQIRVTPVRVINEENVQVGVIEITQALSMAAEAGLDLVEVSPNEEPPVCRIMDYGKWKYRQSKKVGKTRAHVSILKEIRLRPKTGVHDQEVKVRRAREFLTKGDKVLFGRYSGTELTVEGEEYLMLKEEDIVAIVR